MKKTVVEWGKVNQKEMAQRCRKYAKKLSEKRKEKKRNVNV